MTSPIERHPTPYPELNAVLSTLVGELQKELGAFFMGAYLQGSFALGDFDPQSDADLVLVTKDTLSPGQVEALQRVHGRIYDLECPWAKHLEGSYFPKDVLRYCSRKGTALWYLGNRARSLRQDIHCNTVVVRWILREKGVTLAGPPPRTLVEEIPAELLKAEMTAAISGWAQHIISNPNEYGNRFLQSFIVLQYCRMLRDLQIGVPGSKRAGAVWGKENLASSWPDLIERAWKARYDSAASLALPADPADLDSTVKFVKYVVEKCHMAATGSA